MTPQERGRAQHSHVKAKHTDSSRKRQRFDTTGERACKSSEPLKLNWPKMHPLTICNAQPYECTLSSPLSQGGNFQSHNTLPQMQRKMSHKLSPLLTMGLIKWVSSTHECHSPWNEPSPEMQLPLKNMPWVQVKCLTSFSGMVRAFTNSNMYSAEGSKIDTAQNAQENI